MRPTRWAVAVAATVTAIGLLLSAPAVQAAPGATFDDVCGRYGGTYTFTPGDPAVYECDDIHLKLVKPASSRVTIAGPFVSFQRAVPDGYACFPGETAEGSGWFEYVGCTIPEN